MAKFKVGDRVRCIDDSDTDCVNRGQEYDVTGVDDPYIYVSEDGEDRGMYAHRFELVPTFTIEPGKHYRTRSGKVTGRVTKGDTGFEAVVDGRVRIFDKAGGAVHGDADLDIVEAWVPKVGERVRRFNGNNPGSVVGHEAVVRAIEDILPYDSKGPWLLFDDDTSGYATSFEPLPVAAPAAPVAAQVDAINEEYGSPPPGKLLKTGQGYGYELARFGGYVWVDIGKTAPITIRADKIAA